MGADVAGGPAARSVELGTQLGANRDGGLVGVQLCKGSLITGPEVSVWATNGNASARGWP